jgi:uncharacterized protein (DUF58 family)
MWPTLIAATGLIAYAGVAHMIWPQLIGCALVGMLASSFLGVRKAPKLGVAIEMPERVTVGDELEVVVSLTNESGRSCRALHIRHRLHSRRRIAADGAGYVDRIPANGDAIVRLNRRVVARGVAASSDVEISMAGAFGFFSRSISLRVTTSVTAWPAAPDPVALQRTRSSLASSPIADVEVSGIRDWRSGDQLRDVHWRSYARSGRPALLERSVTTSSCLVVVVLAAPTRQGRWRDDPDFERAVSLAAEALRISARDGEPTCVVTPGVGDGMLHSGDGAALLDRLAGVTLTTEPDQALMRHAVQHAGRGGSVLLVSNGSTPGGWKSRLFDAAAKADVTVVESRKLLASADPLRGSR